jgi:hypothetical protein
VVRILEVVAKDASFRAKCHLRGRDQGLAQLHGPTRLREYVVDVITRWIAEDLARRD